MLPDYIQQLIFGLDGVDAHQRSFMCFSATCQNWQASNENGANFFLTLLWTPPARRKALSESYATHAIFMLKM